MPVQKNAFSRDRQHRRPKTFTTVGGALGARAGRRTAFRKLKDIDACTDVSVNASGEAVAAAVSGPDSRGFFYVQSPGCCGGEEEAYLFKRGG